ncbi:MAG: hypothetical protein OXU36_21730 [Candidatus Poribacteria bacterium]|nr:hypothetical protein [Candidatus Poribacteria bacterium]
MAQYDILVKHIIDLFAREFACLALDTPEVEILGRLTTEQPTLKMHHNDVTLKVQLHGGETAILHIEIQTDDSREKPMPLRVLAYSSFLMLQHEMPVYSIVFYLRPPAGATDPGRLHHRYGPELGLELDYKVIRLYELEGEPVLSSDAIGLLPFTPLMSPPSGTSGRVWVEKCVSAAVDAPVDETTRATLLFGMSVFGSFVHPDEFFRELITEEIMQESPFYESLRQRHLQEGIERGARAHAIENTLAVLNARFPGSDVDRVKAILEGVGDLERLKTLNLNASLVPSFEVFLRGLDN